MATCYCKATRCCVAVFTGTTGEGGMLLCDSLALVISKGDVLLCGCLAFTAGEGKNGICVYNWQGDVLLRGCFCMVLVLATRCCVTVFLCTSNSGNLLLWHTIMEGIRCCEILFMRNELEPLVILIEAVCFFIGSCPY